MIWEPEYNFDRGFASSFDGGDSLYDLFDAIARGFENDGSTWQNERDDKGLVRNLLGYLVVRLERMGQGGEEEAEKAFSEVHKSYTNDSRKREMKRMRAVHEALGQIVPSTSLSSSSSTSYSSLAFSSFSRSSFIREHGTYPRPEKLLGVLPYELKGGVKGDRGETEWHLELAREILGVESLGREERDVVGKDMYEMESPKEMRDLAEEEVGRIR